MISRLLVLELLLVLLMFGAGGDVGVLVLLEKDADNASGNFVVDYSLVVLAKRYRFRILWWR